MSLGQNVLRQNVLGTKCSWDEMSLRQNVLGDKMPWRKNVRMDKTPWTESPGKRHPGAKYPVTKCSSVIFFNNCSIFLLFKWKKSVNQGGKICQTRDFATLAHGKIHENFTLQLTASHITTQFVPSQRGTNLLQDINNFKYRVQDKCEKKRLSTNAAQ